MSSSANRSDAVATRVSVIGAGAAGLMAGWTLSRGGVDVTVYEASDRIGGRIHSVVGALGMNLVTELGAEFIDSGHTDVLNLVRRFGLSLIDTHAASEQGLATSYFFNGIHYSEAQVRDEFAPLAARMQEDARSVSRNVSQFSHAPADAALDNLSIAEYLDRVGASGWIRKLIEVAYTTEYGVDVEDQSCLNLLSVILLDDSSQFSMFGESDERFKVEGGNERIVQCLASGLNKPVELGHRLVLLGPCLSERLGLEPSASIGNQLQFFSWRHPRTRPSLNGRGQHGCGAREPW
jgi:monoamine oxidase